MARSLMRGVGGLAVIGALAACSTAAMSSPPGNAETDRVATIVSDAISFPRQDSANGFALAAMATSAGRSSTLTVVEAEEIQADTIDDALARLVFQVHFDAQGVGTFSSTPAITACSEARFNFYGVIDEPRRVLCPAGGTAIVPVPTAPLPPDLAPGPPGPPHPGG